MTLKDAKNIVLFGLIAAIAIVSFDLSSVYAEENEGYNMIGDVAPVLTFTFRDGVETHEFPVFNMGENFVSDSGVSFSVEGTVTNSPLLHKAMDEAYIYRHSNDAFDYHFKYFDVDATFVKEGESVYSLDYNNCRVDNYNIETLDSNDYESYFKGVGFAIVDKIDFVCSGVSNVADTNVSAGDSFTDYGESGFTFANNVNTSVTFSFDEGTEKISFPVFKLVSGYAESTRNVIAEFSVEGILDYYPLLQDAVNDSRKVSGLSTPSHSDFNALVEFNNGVSTLRGFDFTDCRVSNAQIATQTDKEEGFTGKSGFAVVNQLTFTCSGITALNMYYDELHGDIPIWKTSSVSNEYVEPIQNTDKGLSAVATFHFGNGVETIEFSMFKQSEVLTATETNVGANGQTSLAADAFTRKATYPTLELRGIVGDYPMLYDFVDENLAINGIIGTQGRVLTDITVDLVSSEEIIRTLDYSHCRPTDYVVFTETNKEESYTKNKFALENIFNFECQGYHPSNPTYDAMNDNVKKANTTSSNDLRNTERWGSGFTVK